MRLLLLALGLLFASCTAQESPQPRLVVVSVWSGVDGEQLFMGGAPYDTTPTLTAIAKGAAVEPLLPRASTPELGVLLTGLAPRENGLISIHEPGHARILPDLPTLAERASSAGWRTLASVSHAKFTLAGLARGFDHWQAPSLAQRSRSASQVVEAIEEQLAAELSTSQDVLLVLHFGDLREDSWLQSTETDAFFEQRIAPFRGKGGPVDEAFDATGEELSVVRRLKRRLFRQGAGPARSAVEASLYGAQLELLDGALASVAQVAKDADASLDWTILTRELWIATSGASDVFERSPAASEPQPELDQVVRVRNSTTSDLNVGLAATDATIEQLGLEPSASRVRSSRTVNLEGVGEVSFSASKRGASLQLSLQGTGCTTTTLWFGERSVSETDLCELNSRNSFDWPAGREAAAAFELRSEGGRRERILLSGSGEFELTLAFSPANPKLLSTLEAQGLAVREHSYRTDCAVISGSLPLEFELPLRVPSSRLGVALFVDGERVPGSELKYRGRLFSVPGRVELLLSPGTWLEPALRGSAPADARAAVELLDPVAPLSSYDRLAPAERTFLQHQNEDE